MFTMYNFEVKTKILVNGEPWGYELTPCNVYLYSAGEIIVKNAEFLHLLNSGFISRVKLGEADTPIFTNKKRSFDTMRSRNFNAPPITGEYGGNNHVGFYVRSHTESKPVFLIDALYVDTSCLKDTFAKAFVAEFKSLPDSDVV